MSFELTLDLSLDARGGHDVFRLEYAGGECFLVVDFGHDYRRRACFVGMDADATRVFVDTVARDAGVAFETDLPLRETPGGLEVTLVGEVEDADGTVWKTMRWHLGPALEVDARFGVDKQTCVVVPRLGSADSVMNAWRGLLFEEPLQTESKTDVQPAWLADSRTWIHDVVALPERFSNRVVWASAGFVGVAEDPGLLFMHDRERGLEIVFETRHIHALAAHKSSVFVVHEDEQGRGLLTLIEDVAQEELDVVDLYVESTPLPSEALVLSPDGAMAAIAVSGRGDARFDTLVVDRAGHTLAVLEDAWPLEWSESLLLRRVDAGGTAVWDGQRVVEAEARRHVGPWELSIQAGAVAFGNHVFASDGAPLSRLEGRVYQPLCHGQVLAHWDRPYLLHPRSGEGWALLPQGMPAQHVVVSHDGEQVLITQENVTFLARVGPSHDDAELAERELSDAFLTDRFQRRELDAGLSLAELGRWHNLSANEVRHRLDEAAQEYLDQRLTKAMQAWEDDVAAVAGLGVDCAGGWVLLAGRLDARTWHGGFTQAIEETFVRRLADEKFLEFALHGGFVPGERVNVIQEALVGARVAWLSPPTSEMQERVALAIEVSLEVLADLRETAVPGNVWDDTEQHAGRLHEMLALGVPDVVGLGETIELLRCIEELATR